MDQVTSGLDVLNCFCHKLKVWAFISVLSLTDVWISELKVDILNWNFETITKNSSKCDLKFNTWWVYKIGTSLGKRRRLRTCRSFFGTIYVHSGEFPVALQDIHLQSLLRAGKMKLFNHLYLWKSHPFKNKHLSFSSFLLF